MSEKKIRQKELKRRNVIDSIRRIEDFLANYDADRDINEVAIRMSRLDLLMENFEEIQGEYETLDENEEFVAANFDIRAMVEEQFFRVKSGLVSKVPPSNPNPIQTPTSVTHNSGVKLPTIVLPHFDGDLNEWLTFHDSYTSLIHTSREIPNIQKFQYLRSALKGEALKIIESLTITSDNYPVAWEALLNRYANKYILKKKHLQALITPPKLAVKSVLMIRDVVDEFQRHVKILNQLGEPTDQWSSLLVQLLSSRIDELTLKEWEDYVSGEEEPSYDNFIKYLSRKIRTLELLSITSQGVQPSSQVKQFNQLKRNSTSTNSRVNSYVSTDYNLPECFACNQRHFLVKCPTFEKMQLKDRLNLVNTKKICSNCFRNDHFARKCQSKFSCRICQKRHHSMLHPGFESQAISRITPFTNSNVTSFNNDFNVLTANSIQSTNPKVTHSGANVLLSTVVLIIQDGYGKQYFARALLDSGSQCNLMSDQLCRRLRLVRNRTNQPVFGIGASPTETFGSVYTNISSRYSNFSIPMEFLVLRQITTNLPTHTIPTTEWRIPENIFLADPEFNISKGIELILGAEYFFSFLKGGRIQIGNPSPVLIESVFGWFATGTVMVNPIITCQMHCFSTIESIDRNLEKFWQIEDIDATIPSANDEICEQFFRETTTRDVTGRYMVKYPKKRDMSKLIGESYSHALRRMESLERRLDRTPELKIKYHDFITEFINMGHMRKVSVSEEIPPVVYYLPHHPVLNESSTTTKVRAVFDASMKFKRHTISRSNNPGRFIKFSSQIPQIQGSANSRYREDVSSNSNSSRRSPSTTFVMAV
ncbi:uncharacterized protein LOC129774354 [Toxorhynchites rutilus septentrionalis]|uniref:uncharacterized protein LOC129774354 n=1 Tax=Toxorhynchites rutilus septentrionalis TaxID=329112 RepID=UPI002479F0DE|nr:uncharacterized protein LOC129774354 [Toxorhynchites rutilus septentrionalis]